MNYDNTNGKSKVKMVKEVLLNKSVKNVLKIKEQYGYEQEVINDHGWGMVIIRNPKHDSPYPKVIKSKRTSMWYIKKLEKLGKLETI